MKGWLLDTNVVSALRKSPLNARVAEWVNAQAAESLFISSVTLVEIRHGIETTEDAGFRADLEKWFTQELRPWFAGRILEVDEEVILEWLRMVARGKRIRHTFSQPDLFIAATAAVHGLGVCTRNESDFAKTGVQLYNPWSK